MKRQIGQRRLLAELVLAGMLIGGAQAQDQVDLGTVQNDASDINGSASNAGSQSAPAQAPSQASLSETEPASIISRHYIENNTGPGSNYTDLISIAPSVFNVDPNGNGLMESQGLSIRGFQDGQYNVTFDGIPIGDSNDFTHHSTSYFMPQDLGAITVDRGPGSAAVIGYATFGGTVANTTKDPSQTAGITPYASYGSFNTKLEGVQFDSGTMKNWGDASAYMDVKQVSSDGYLSYSHQRRTNAIFKMLKPLGDNTMLTFMSMVNQLDQNPPSGATLTQMQMYGNNFGLSNNPNSQSFIGYNRDQINGDMSYIGLNSEQGSWTLDDKIYTFGYRHIGYNGQTFGPPYNLEAGGQYSNLTPGGMGGGLGTQLQTAQGYLNQPNDVPGVSMTMQYRSVGNVFRASDHLAAGDLNLGVWFDHQYNSRSNQNVDWSMNGAPNYMVNGSQQTTPSSYNWLMSDSWNTFQPYAEFAWKPVDGLTVRPGLKYVSFERGLNATINNGTGLPMDYSKRWSKALPSLDVHYNLSSNWSTYAQASEGFLAPNLKYFYINQPGQNTLQPQSTRNYQWGTVYKTGRFTADFDAYLIDFSNEILSGTINNNTYYYNSNGATRYKGVEGEATYFVGYGTSLYANGSVNSAHDSAGNWLPNTPVRTAAAGLIYDKNGIYASLMDKYIGSYYTGQSGSLYPNSPSIGNYMVNGYSMASLSASYSFGRDQATKVSMQVDNLFNKGGLYYTNGTAPQGDILFWGIPGRSVTVSLSSKI